MRPIDADALQMTCRIKSLRPDDARALQYAIQTMINTAPTIDVSPVVHGHWIDTHGEDWICSVCGVECYTDEDYMPQNSKAFHMNYCHYCGAKMDGKGDNE